MGLCIGRLDRLAYLGFTLFPQIRERFRLWREKRRKYYWRCVRDGGGGVLTTPKPMTRDYAVAWVARVAGPILFVDEYHKHIFYHSRQPGGN